MMLRRVQNINRAFEVEVVGSAYPVQMDGPGAVGSSWLNDPVDPGVAAAAAVVVVETGRPSWDAVTQLFAEEMTAAVVVVVAPLEE